MPEPQTISTLHPQFQQPVLDWLSQQVTSGLRGGLPQFPGYEGLAPVYDPATTQQYFQDVFVAPTMRGLTGPYGAIPRIGARAAQRGTYFSSGRQQSEAKAVSGAYSGLAGAYSGLIGEDLGAIRGEWMRRQPTGQIARQALNYLGTPMTLTYEDQPSPWSAAFGGAASGAAVGSMFGPWGTAIGAGIGGTLGYFGSR